MAGQSLVWNYYTEVHQIRSSSFAVIAYEHNATNTRALFYFQNASRKIERTHRMGSSYYLCQTAKYFNKFNIE
jgi:hypothetical protein